MAKQSMWIGITIGVFFAGLGIGYAAFQAAGPTPNMQMWQNMMQDPNQRQQMLTHMMSDPAIMQQMDKMMMSDPDHMVQMHQMMMNDQAHMKEMHQMMVDDPEHMKRMAEMMGPHMLDTMVGDPQMRQHVMDRMQNMTGAHMQPGMSQGMMSP